jgi:hypothetical protein
VKVADDSNSNPLPEDRRQMPEVLMCGHPVVDGHLGIQNLVV